MRRDLVVAIGLVVLTLAVFQSVRGHEFVDLDDRPVVIENPHVVGGLTWENVRGAFLEPYYANWTPLAWISLALDRSLFGEAPAGVLLHNVFQHALAAVLLFFAIARMTGAFWPSAFVAAVFAVHPLHVESVAWASERRDTLSGLFGMATLLFYGRYAARPSAGRYALVVVAFALGLLSKSVLVTLPLCLLLLDHWPLRRLRGDGAVGWPEAGALGRAGLEKLPLLALSVAVSAITMAAQRSGGGMRPDDVAFPFGLRLQNALASYGVYLRDSFWPVGLAAYHPFPVRGLPLAEVAIACALLAVVSGIALVSWRARPAVFVGIAWFLVTLVPMIGLVHVGHQAHADRYTYIPLIGLSIAVAWAAQELAERRPGLRQGIAGAGFVAVAVLAVGAARQVTVWRDTVTLFEHAANVTEDNFFALHALAVAYRQQGDAERAEQFYRETIRAEPNFVSVKIELADWLRERGRAEEGLPLLRDAIRLRPGNGAAQRLLGLTLLEMGRFAEADAELARALSHGEDLARLHAGLGITSSALGQTAQALHHNREALSLDPGQVEAANNLAWALATAADPARRDAKEAIRVAESARERVPDSADLLDTLAAAYAADARFADAIAAAEGAIARYESAGHSAQATGARERLARYRAGEAYVEAPPPSPPG